jgi:uncharacterized protein (DUF1501 family)
MTELEPVVATKACGCPDFDRALTRRSFLKRAGIAGLVAGIASETAFTQLAFGAGAYTGDVLVILSLRGGMDGLQVVVPTADPDYLTWRTHIGIQQSSLIPLDATFGLHPALGAVKPLWDSGLLGFVHAVGMAEPNRSHFSAMEEMERAAPGTSLRTGWIDRVIGRRTEGTVFQAMQVGSGMASTAFIGPSPELAMWSVDGFDLEGAGDATELHRWNKVLNALYAGSPTTLGKPARAVLGALATTAQMKVDGYSPENGATYPNTDLGNALKDVARLIKRDIGLEVAAVDYGDWDMHADMGDVDTGWMHDHLTELGNALLAFATDMGSGMDNVTFTTLTEFGRRVEDNGSGGTDHGYGQLVTMMGGGIKGGAVHLNGAWPTLAANKLLDGDLKATTDYRALLAELLQKRCKASSGDVNAIFPGIGSITRPDVANLKP